jgi:hypothetical protein
MVEVTLTLLIVRDCPGPPQAGYWPTIAADVGSAQAMCVRDERDVARR